MQYGKDYDEIRAYIEMADSGIPVRPDIFVSMDQTVNSVFIKTPEENGFILVDTGMPNRAKHFIRVAKELFGKDARPKAILLTHGHFDHVGSVIELVKEWDVPVYAHKDELPYLTGKKKYKLPFTPQKSLATDSQKKVKSPTEAIDLGMSVHALPDDFSVPFLPDFEWVPAPGHSPGQVAFFRKSDGTLLAGDAFITTSQEDLFSVLTPEKIISGPPRILTTQWEMAKKSVERLAMLRPQLAVTGHGIPFRGEELRQQLSRLIECWEKIAPPAVLQMN